MDNYILEIRHKLNASIIPVGANKIPLVSKWQTSKLTSQELSSYDNALMYGLVCGTVSDGIECLDIDLKVLDTKEERDTYEKELLDYLSDNVDNFYKKVAIYRTLNNGLHIIYKAENIEGNKKLATYKDKKEAVIESRGIGGYIQIYPKFHHRGLKYEEITKVTNEDRNILVECCKSLTHEIKVQVEPKETKKETQQDGLSPWSDYNGRTNVFDLISNEFTLVRQLSNYSLIKRNGAESLTSGKIFNDSNCIYLHSTGTRYDAEKLLSPFIIYTVQNHNGDFTASSKDLYSKGFGTRFEPNQYDFKEEEKTKPIKKNDFPLDIFPKEIKHYIKENKDKLGLIADFMGSAVLWTASTVIGNSLNIQIKNGWTDNCTVWIACVASAGVGKTPSISSVTRPLEKLNQKEQKLYAKEEKKYSDFKNMSKEEKAYQDEVKQPTNRQFLANDITLEALTGLLAQNPNGVGVLEMVLIYLFGLPLSMVALIHPIEKHQETHL